MRSSGILLPVSALPTPYGIGGFSREAYEFVDRLQEAGQKYWQVLPLGPTGYGDSPYQSFSTFAGNSYYISLDILKEEGLLTEEECREADCGANPRQVDYGWLYVTRSSVLRKAFGRFVRTEDYSHFIEENRAWLEDYILYMVIRDQQKGACWNQWPREWKSRQPQALEQVQREFSEELDFYRFLQYEFSKQWQKLKKYANDRGVRIIGDIPFYVAMDSADAWSHPELFQFDEKQEPKAVAGCPPDAFAATGQLWGNPLYRWDYHRQRDFDWWTRRMAHSLQLYDVVRVDHFRGFESYYSVPYGDKTAEGGHWEQGPGLELFQVLEEKLGKLDVIAEDLGYLTEDVHQMVRESGFPGMKVLEFAFDSGVDNLYLPHNHSKNCVVYTGTHDNDTVLGWYDHLNEGTRHFLRAYMNNEGSPREKLPWEFIRMAMASVANLAMVPMQDYLCLGGEARMNFPSTQGTNWKWRMLPGEFSSPLAEKIRSLAHLYGRS